MIARLVPIGSFIAKTSDGRSVRLNAYQQFHHDGTAGLKVLKTDTGIAVRWKERGVYEVATPDGDYPLTSDDPGAM